MTSLSFGCEAGPCSATLMARLWLSCPHWGLSLHQVGWLLCLPQASHIEAGSRAGQCRPDQAKSVPSLQDWGVGSDDSRGCQKARGGKVQEDGTGAGSRLLAFWDA